MSSKPSTLHEACTPIFLFLTSFRRNAETSPLGIDELHRVLQREFERLERSCDQDRKLRAQFDRLQYALVAAADQVVLSSNWPHRAGWSLQILEQRLFHTSEGGSKFFAVVDEVMADSSNDAADLAHVLFDCMALGFQGELLGERKELERRRQLLFEKARLRGALDEPLTPEAYGKNSPRTLNKLPTSGIVRFVLVALGAVLLALLAGDAVTSFKNRKVNARIEEQAQRLQAEQR